MLYYPATAAGQAECLNNSIAGWYGEPSEALPTILLVDLGGCAADLKALHSQSAGAKAVVLVDSRPEPLPSLSAGADAATQARLLQIALPVGVVSQEDGAALKSLLNASGAGGLVVSLDATKAVAPQKHRCLV